MSRSRKGSRPVALILSVVLHGALALALLMLPTEADREHWDIVDMSLVEKKKPEPESVPVEEPEEVEEMPVPVEPVKKKKEPPKPPPPAPVPDEKPEDKKKEEAPPVFDLGDNTFAKKGDGSSWSLNRSEGNTKFAGVAKPGQKSVRNTKPKTDPTGKPGGTGFEPVSTKDLSKKAGFKGGSPPKPKYPLEARRQDIEGLVVVRLFVSRKGRIRKIHVVKDPGGGLADATRKLYKGLVLEPAINKTGQPVDSILTLSFRYVLDS